MKSTILIFIAMLAFSFAGQAQLKKVEWSTETKKIDENTYHIILKANVDEGWYIYSQHMDEGGPLPTSIQFDNNNFTPQGKVDENGEIIKEGFDEVFEIEVKKYGQQAIFTQVVKTNGEVPNGVAMVSFMTCSEDRCNPPSKVEISF